MSCLKSGKCNVEQKLWCRGYECKEDKIVKQSELRSLGEKCNVDAECTTGFCALPSCEALKSMGLEDKCNSLGGVCVFPKKITISDKHDF